MPTGLGSRPTFSCSHPRSSRYISFARQWKIVSVYILVKSYSENQALPRLQGCLSQASESSEPSKVAPRNPCHRSPELATQGPTVLSVRESPSRRSTETCL